MQTDDTSPPSATTAWRRRRERSALWVPDIRSGQRAAETVANAIPRRTQDHAHFTPTTITNEKDRL
jgi:hypothetical protein